MELIEFEKIPYLLSEFEQNEEIKRILMDYSVLTEKDNIFREPEFSLRKKRLSKNVSSFLANVSTSEIFVREVFLKPTPFMKNGVVTNRPFDFEAICLIYEGAKNLYRLYTSGIWVKDFSELQKAESYANGLLLNILDKLD